MRVAANSAIASATAPSAKAAVKPDSAARPVPASMWSATIAAAIWPPKAPPTVRMIVFMPVASPVWCWGTASTIRFAIEANDRPMPRPSSVTARSTCHSCECATAKSRKESPAKPVPRSRGSFEPRRPDSQPAIGPATSMTAAEGSRKRPAPVVSTAKP